MNKIHEFLTGLLKGVPVVWHLFMVGLIFVFIFHLVAPAHLRWLTNDEQLRLGVFLAAACAAVSWKKKD